jgi:hypothetical protein
MLIALKGTSQPSLANDTCTCIPNSQLIAALKDRQEHKICKQERDKLSWLYDLCKQRLTDKDNTIALYRKLDDAHRSDSTRLESEKQNINLQKQVFEIDNVSLGKQVKKYKAQATIFKGVAGAILLGLLYMAVKK